MALNAISFLVYITEAQDILQGKDDIGRLA